MLFECVDSNSFAFLTVSLAVLVFSLISVVIFSVFPFPFSFAFSLQPQDFDGHFCHNCSSVFGGDTQPSEQDLQNFWWLINFNNGKHLFHNLITYISDRIQHRERWVSALQASSIPLALINGSVDPVSGSHMVARYKELECRLDYCAELPTIGHYPQVEAPQDVLAHYLAFLNGVVSGVHH